MIWNNLKKITNFNYNFKNKIFNLKYPSVLGTSYNNNINGIVSEHSYSIIGIMIDDYFKKYIRVFNSQRNIKSRETIFCDIKKKYLSNIKMSRFGLWALDECPLFVSDFTISL